MLIFSSYSLPSSTASSPPCFIYCLVYLCVIQWVAFWISCLPRMQEVLNFLLLVQVRGGQLWGTDVYTDDSDLVAGMWFDEKVSTSKLNGYHFMVLICAFCFFFQYLCIQATVAQLLHLPHLLFRSCELWLESYLHKIVSL